MVGSKLEQQPTHDWDWIFRLLEKESDDVYLRYYNYELRSYQRESIDAILSYWADHGEAHGG